MHQLSAILVDKKSTQSSFLEYQLTKTGFFKKLYASSSINEIFSLLETQRIEVIFFNFNLESDDKVLFLNRFLSLNLPIKVVFISTPEKCDFETLHMAGLEYLLTPFDPLEVKYFVIRRLKQQDYISTQYEKLAHLHRLLKTSEVIELPFEPKVYSKVSSNDILFLEEKGNHTDIWFKDGKNQTSKNELYHFEPYLPIHYFLRINRNTIINKTFIDRLDEKNKICQLSSPGKQYELKFSQKVWQKLERYREQMLEKRLNFNSYCY